MTYIHGYVVAILKDGVPLRQQGDTVYLPYGSEYSILLRNKSNFRSCADIYIDGAKANSSSFVLEPHSKLEIKRFMLDGDLNSGASFKFVEASEAANEIDVDHKDAGVVEVRFYKEAASTVWVNTPPFPDDIFRRLNTDWTYGTTVSKSSYTIGSAPTQTYSCSVVEEKTADKGVTTQGKIVNQGFTEVEWNGTNEYSEVKIRIRLKAPKKAVATTQIPKGNFCTNCGAAVETTFKFCHNCGNKLRANS